MTTKAPHLAAKIRKPRGQARITADFEHVIARCGTWSGDGVWYTSQKEHWLGWLSECSGPGYHGRGVPKGRLSKSKQAASASPQLQTQSATSRKIIPWKMIEARPDQRSR